ncbi:hypothetical protein J4H92_08975 [Leucobacter weissii]|uniref:Secreted protein n=1 Tax=Leucobacter weissii TaxID=1983706 RepID=A0A939MNZ3_9MICO|nr:hypothetical protein [Leucobacter weissii]MBO1902077.1 hypothetical protein [Leucobacter weissii]
MERTSARIGRGVTAFAALAAATLLVGCASPLTDDDPGEGVPRSEPETLSESYVCGWHRFPASAIEQPRRIADLEPDERAAITGATDDLGEPLELGDLASWIVISANDENIALIRPNSERPPGYPDSVPELAPMPDYEEQSLFRSTKTEGWMYGSNGRCRLTFDLGDLQVPDVVLDPERSPDPDSTELPLLVLDSSCGGDTDMPDRIEVVSVEESDTEVGLLLGTSPLPEGAYACPGFSPTPYTLQLDAPLGDRVVVDLSRVQRLELTDATAAAVEP